MVIIFCGIPGTGKTTIAGELAANFEKLGRVKLITSDELPEGKVYQRVFKLIQGYLDKTDYILVDATFYKKKWRERVGAIAGEENVKICYLHCSLTTCLQRNRQREPSLPERVIYIINKEMERPENPDVSINTENMGAKQAVVEILDQLDFSPGNRGACEQRRATKTASKDVGRRQ
jgi:tRNA uridine 5-carbamoylmethylation protein Kti12